MGSLPTDDSARMRELEERMEERKKQRARQWTIDRRGGGQLQTPVISNL